MAPETRIAFHQRAQHDILEKIKRTYGLTEADWALSPVIQHALDTKLQEMEASPQRRAVLDRMLGAEASDAERNAANRDIADTARHYMHAFHIDEAMHKRIFEMLTTPRDDSSDRYMEHYLFEAERMTDCYVNHISNEAQERFTAYPHGSLEAAYHMQRHIVGSMILLAKETPPYIGFAKVNPAIDETESAEHNVEMIRNLWHTQRDKLVESYREMHPVAPPHQVARLEARRKAAERNPIKNER